MEFQLWLSKVHEKLISCGFSVFLAVYKLGSWINLVYPISCPHHLYLEVVDIRELQKLVSFESVMIAEMFRNILPSPKFCY